MNMIVNASDLVGYEAENKKSKESARKEVLAKLVAVWEGKNSRSAKKFGTLGLLAVSLAACNSDDDDTSALETQVSDLTAQLAAANAATAAAEAASGSGSAATATVASLTTGIDTATSTSGDDSINAGFV